MRPPKSAVMQEQPSHSMPRCSPDCTPLAEPKTDWGLWRSRSACRRQRTQRHRGHRQVVRPLPPRCLCLCVEEVLTIPLESLGLNGRKSSSSHPRSFLDFCLPPLWKHRPRAGKECPLEKVSGGFSQRGDKMSLGPLQAAFGLDRSLTCPVVPWCWLAGCA